MQPSTAAMNSHSPLQSVLPPSRRLSAASLGGEWVQTELDFRGPGWIDRYTSAVIQTSVAGNNYTCWDGPRYLCSVRLGGIDLPRVRNLSSWRWRTADGELVPPVDPVRLGSLMVQQPVALLGDSLTQELFASLTGLLAKQKPRTHSRARNASLASEAYHEVLLANGGRLARLDNTLMRLAEASRFGAEQAGSLHALLRLSAEKGYRVLVMSALMMRPDASDGCPRAVPSSTLANDEALAATVGAHFRSSGPRLDLLVFISFDPNHPACHQYTDARPAYTRPSLEQMAGEDLIEYTRWCWAHVKERSERLAEAFRRHLAPEHFALIDARQLTGTRPEAHAVRIPSPRRPFQRCCDCMHFCLPGGPVETWADLLQAVLLQRFAGQLQPASDLEEVQVARSGPREVASTAGQAAASVEQPTEPSFAASPIAIAVAGLEATSHTALVPASASLAPSREPPAPPAPAEATPVSFRLAHCVTGLLKPTSAMRGSRPVTDKHQRSALKAWLRSLRAGGASSDVFLVLDPAEYDAKPKVLGNAWRESARNATDQLRGCGGFPPSRASHAALQTLRGIAGSLREAADHVESVAYEESGFCCARPDVCACGASYARWWEQVAKHRAAFALVKARESRLRRSYGWVTKLRPDYPIEPLGALASAMLARLADSARDAGGSSPARVFMHADQHSAVPAPCHATTDWFALVPRVAARAFFEFATDVGCEWVQGTSSGHSAGRLGLHQHCFRNEGVLAAWIRSTVGTMPERVWVSAPAHGSCDLRLPDGPV